MTVTLPPEYNPLLLKDGRIHIMRSVNGGPSKREGDSCYLIRRWDYAEDYTTITAVHANDIMRRRAILYNLVFTILSGPSDDRIKSLFYNNYVCANCVGFRFGGTTQYDISSLVSIQASIGAAPTTLKYPQWRNVLDIILELCYDATQNGTFLTAEIVAPTESTLELQTFIGQRGSDRRFSTGNGLLFTSKRGNLENAILTVDATEEITLALAAGPERDTGAAGTNAYAQDATRMAQSPFGRIEQFIDSTAPDATGLLSDATAAVRDGRPVIHAVGDLVETDQCVRGVHYDYGDYLTVELQGIQYDMRLNIMEVTINASGDRTIARFEYNA